MSASDVLKFDQVLALCRPGFESDCANEFMFHSTQLNIPAYVKARPDTGFIQLILTGESDALTLVRELDFDQLIFCRQWLASSSKLTELPEKQRTTTIRQHVAEMAIPFQKIELSYADTNTGKSLNKFCKQFFPHLKREFKNSDFQKSSSTYKLNLFFQDSTHVFIGLTPLYNSANVAMGIPRLKMPSSAPSRSTLKLEEAIHTFLDTEQQKTYLRPGMRAVDLGAAPGGWTWQLVQRQLFVNAIDNGPMDKDLMDTEMVEHLKTDAFSYSQKKVDWLVCDMVEQPHRVSKLIANWFSKGWCKHAIFNLKLPMKKRYEAVRKSEQILRNTLDSIGTSYSLRFKHLYHDREEVTVCILTGD